MHIYRHDYRQSNAMLVVGQTKVERKLGVGRQRWNLHSTTWAGRCGRFIGCRYETLNEQLKQI